MNERPVRVRFAPSPTGPLHIGGVRTALYNYLFARQQGGRFIIRIEDTDQNRWVGGAEEYIFQTLDWCGLQADEGPQKGGPFAPYKQSERKAIYRHYAELLLQNGHAYYAFDTNEELEAMRQRQQQAGSESQQYDVITRMTMQNALTLSATEVETRLKRGDPYVIRARIPAGESLTFTDLIRGEVVIDTNRIDDKVLFKSDGWPTYHLANVVDDFLMQITHVIRGEEWLPSAPLHVLLYRFFGWQEVMPQFAHLPLLLKPDGNGKLSKRDGDRLGFPVFALDWKDPKTGELSRGFRERGFFPEALINFMAVLGWHPTGDQELFSMDELISDFSIGHIHKAGARFDYEKAKWYNQEYLKRKNGTELAGLLAPLLESNGVQASPDFVARVCEVLKQRCHFVSELWDNGQAFFRTPSTYDETVVKARWNEKAQSALAQLATTIDEQTDFTAAAIDALLHSFMNNRQLKAGELLPILRVALIGSKNGPAVFEIISLLGRKETLSRIAAASVTFDSMIRKT